MIKRLIKLYLKLDILMFSIIGLSYSLKILSESPNFGIFETYNKVYEETIKNYKNIFRRIK